MRKEEALERYKKKVDTNILKYYEDADEFQWFNTNDVDLHPIRTRLPECPEWHRIENFGLPKEKQVFHKEEMPNILEYLINKSKKTINYDKSLSSRQAKEDAFYDLIWTDLESSIKYKKALEWLAMQWYHRLYGKWFFINGKPTYLPPNHWFYLNYWHLEGVGLPEYRDRDRKWFWAMQYFKKDTTSPKFKWINTPQGKVRQFFYHDDGSLELVDRGYRTVDGVIVAKGRRMGDTSKATCDLFCDTSLMQDGKWGIQGDTEDTGKLVFKEKVRYAFDRLPFFWKPRVNYNVEQAIVMESKDTEESLGAIIDYKSAHPSSYDSRRLDRYYADEPGKLERWSIHERHSIVRLCLRKGTRLAGFSIYTTTVSDMSSSAGQNFEKLCRNSMFEERGEDGSTGTGMILIHFPAYEGYEGFIGKYGESVIENPTPEQLKYIDKKEEKEDGTFWGAKDDILIGRELHREKGDYEKVCELKRLHPLSFAESFAPPANNVYFNMDILEERYNELKRNTSLTTRGNFIGDVHGGVVFQPDDEGRFIVSKLMPAEAANKKYQMGGEWYPQNANRFVASADVFRSDRDKVEGYRMSNGGGAVKWKFDPKVDSEDEDVENWQSGIFVCTYRYRPDTTDEFCDDMLKMCVYYGALMYPENNIEHVYRYFIEHGFGGYLLYDTDPETGKPKSKPGFHSGQQMKQKLFNLTRNYISAHGKREKHLDYINECLSIRNLDEMTKFDLFTACGGCLLAEESSYGEYLKEDETYDVSDVFRL